MRTGVPQVGGGGLIYRLAHLVMLSVGFLFILIVQWSPKPHKKALYEGFVYCRVDACADIVVSLRP